MLKTSKILEINICGISYIYEELASEFHLRDVGFHTIMIAVQVTPSLEDGKAVDGKLPPWRLQKVLGSFVCQGGGCTFPDSWTGSWFLSGYPSLIAINSTHIQSKGECSERESTDKFLLYDRSDDSYRCMVIHEKHKYVLQYKESPVWPKDSLSTICEQISGDAPLYSMFRKEPRPVPQECPFHPAPFTFTYNRGTGDCTNPPSRAEACTDNSRLLLRYMACPDVPGTESNGDDEHNRCHFPSWILEHHKWFSLDHTHQYHFTTKNATLKIMNTDGSYEEKRLVCHSILEQKEKKHIKLVAHVTRGCESGHACLKFYRRSSGVLELQQGSSLWDSPEDACTARGDPEPYLTLISTNLVPMRCPILGRYNVVNSPTDRRRRRQQATIGSEVATECVAGAYESVSFGCGNSQDTIEFSSHCATT
ncbi:hypothetical protein evm_000875, partial [Chilo suppressalis]